MKAQAFAGHVLLETRPIWRTHVVVHAIFTRSLSAQGDFLRRSYARKHRVTAVLTRAAAMDALYLLLLIALVGSTAAFLRLCARLEDRS